MKFLKYYLFATEILTFLPSLQGHVTCPTSIKNNNPEFILHLQNTCSSHPKQLWCYRYHTCISYNKNTKIHNQNTNILTLNFFSSGFHMVRSGRPARQCRWSLRMRSAMALNILPPMHASKPWRMIEMNQFTSLRVIGQNKKEFTRQKVEKLAVT